MVVPYVERRSCFLDTKWLLAFVQSFRHSYFLRPFYFVVFLTVVFLLLPACSLNYLRPRYYYQFETTNLYHLTVCAPNEMSMQSILGCNITASAAAAAAVSDDASAFCADRLCVRQVLKYERRAVSHWRTSRQSNDAGMFSLFRWKFINICKWYVDNNLLNICHFGGSVS